MTQQMYIYCFKKHMIVIEKIINYYFQQQRITFKIIIYNIII